MRWSGSLRALCRGALVGGLLAASGALADASPKKGEKSGAIDIPIPVGEDAKGVKIPIYGERGKLEMTLEMQLARKLDKARMQMEGAEVQTFGEGGAQDLRISLPKSVINLESRVVTSEDPVRIERKDFSLTGESMEFDLKTKSGHLDGKILMLIYERDKLTTSEPE